MPASPPAVPTITLPSMASGASVSECPVALSATWVSQRTEPEAARQLAVVLIEGGGKDRLEEALRHLEAAESVNRRLGMDVASCVLYQVWALRGLERDQEALKRGRRYFESPPPAPASAKVLERLRAQLAEIEGGRSKR